MNEDWEERRRRRRLRKGTYMRRLGIQVQEFRQKVGWPQKRTRTTTNGCPRSVVSIVTVGVFQ